MARSLDRWTLPGRGDALSMLDDLTPDVRVINLETSITRSSEFAASKGVHYRMSPDNVACVTAVLPDACALANNHVLDFGRQRLVDMLDALSRAGLHAVGAGHAARHAREPVIVPVADAHAIVVSCGSGSSGIPSSWAATRNRAGVNFVPDLSDLAAAEIAEQVTTTKRPG